MVIARNLSLRYSSNQSPILNDISVAFPAGRITVLLGKSGAGKTSLLRCIAGLEKPVQGNILVDGKDLALLKAPQRASLVGIVFQQFNLFPHLTVLRNCMQPLMINKKMFAAEAQTRAIHYLQLVEMEAFTHRYPSQLSGGQQQRVALARALCLEPRVLLLDEPTSALDPASTRTLQRLLLQLASQELSIVISSHDMEFVRSVLDRAYLIDQGTIADESDVKNALGQGWKINQFLTI